MSRPRRIPGTLVVTSCGTSILTNGATKELKQKLLGAANRTESELTASERRSFRTREEHRGRELMAASLPDLKKMSAELNGILTLLDGYPHPPAGSETVHHRLIHTDTHLGRASADLLRMRLVADHQEVEAVRIRDLATATLEGFQLAMAELAKWCDEQVQPMREAGFRVVFNLTGGFKPVQGFLQTLGMFHADETVYIFEGAGSELLRIPRMPISVDIDGVIREHREALRRLSAGDDLPVDACANIPELLWMQVDDRASLSPWGEILWAQARERIYGNELLPSLSGKLEFSPAFRAAAEELPGHRLIILNRQMDRLAAYLERAPGSKPPKAVGLKPHAEAPAPSTHRFRAWSDADAKRCLAHYEADGKLVVDELTRHD